MSRRRAAVLIALHVLIIAHVTQWLITGRTVSPIEPSEAMYTLNDGHLNAGFIFFGLSILATLTLGRFVCGWGCHVVAYQDLCAWLMKKIGIKPKPFRSRLLVLAPLALALYMFVWPTVYRWAVGAPAPQLSNHLTTSEFWKTFPGPVVAILTIAVCGFAIIYFLGAKGFCTYGCPYGGFFGLADKAAVGRIRVTDDCEHCGHCTAVCSSNVKVHEEVALYGMVVDPGCMKCMDCVSVCPNDALYYGFGKPSLNAKPAAERKPVHFDFSLREELVMIVVGLACLLAFRGLYGQIPLLMAMGMAAISAFVFMKLWRMIRDSNVRLQQWQLKRGGRLTRPGAVFLTASVTWTIISVHSGVVQANTWRGRSLLRNLNPGDEIWASGNRWWEQATPDEQAQARAALNALVRADNWGLMDSPALLIDSLRANLAVGNVAEAERAARRLVAIDPESGAAYRGLANVLRKQGRVYDAEVAYRKALELSPDAPEIRWELASLLVENNRADEVPNFYKDLTPSREDARIAQLLLQSGNARAARATLQRLTERFADDASLHTMLGTACVAVGEQSVAMHHFQRAMQLDPTHPELHYQIGMANLAARRIEDAIRSLSEAVRLAPDMALYRYNLAVATFMSGRPSEALPYIKEAIRLDPTDPDAHGFLGVILRELGDIPGAQAAEAEAQRLMSR